MASISKASMSSILSCVSIFIFQYVFASGFTIDLIHRDSPLSPYYDPSLSHSERLHNAFHRSFSRAANSFAMQRISSGGIESEITSNRGEYLMKFSIGTPPVETIAIADTGSDLAWIQCKPCTECYDQTTAIFQPSASSTYRNLDCQSKQCNSLDAPSCGGKNTCQYRMDYGDRSSSEGDLAVDTFGFTSSSGQKSAVYVPKVVFGCGHDNKGTFVNGSGEGIIGLGGGPLSIVNQMKTFVNGKFSYCLVPIGSPENVTSKLKFGSDALVSGHGAVSTPLVSKEPVTYYYLTLESVSVGDKKLAYMKTCDPKSLSSSTIEEGNIIIDSGTTLTLLPSEFYQNLETNLEQAINGKRVTDPSGQFSLCYEVDANIQFPNIIFHFTDADIELKSTNTFLEVSTGTVCLTLVPSDDVAIFGNLSQMDLLVGYDTIANKVSFLPSDCTKQ